MNAFSLNIQTINYIDNFLDQVKHLHNIIRVKTTIVRTQYGAMYKVKIYRKIEGVWDRFSQHVGSVKCPTDLHILQGILYNYETMLQYMYDNIHNSYSDSS